jgi:hypothetical protein
MHTWPFYQKLLPIGLWVFISAASSCKVRENQSGKMKSAQSAGAVRIDPEFYPIVSPPDPIVKNRKITRSYFFGGEALRQALSRNGTESSFNANWLHFAIWGSMRAGESIEGTDIQVAATTKDFVFDSIERSLSWLPPDVRQPYLDSIRKNKNLLKTMGAIVKDSLTAGNQHVAHEILGVTDQYLRFLGCATTFNDLKLQEFLRTFRYSLPETAAFVEIWNQLLSEIPALTKGKLFGGGQDALALAFATYHKARFESDPKIRAEMMYYANVLIAIHEQTVLQTYISGAIGILDPASSLYRKVATLLAMDIGLPDVGFTGVSTPGKGLKRYPLRNGFSDKNFAPELREFTWMPLVDLARVTGLDVGAGRGATDWLDFQSRILLIGGLMRTFQSSKTVAAFPFSGPRQDVNLFCDI